MYLGNRVVLVHTANYYAKQKAHTYASEQSTIWKFISLIWASRYLTLINDSGKPSSRIEKPKRKRSQRLIRISINESISFFWKPKLFYVIAELHKNFKQSLRVLVRAPFSWKFLKIDSIIFYSFVKHDPNLQIGWPTPAPSHGSDHQGYLCSISLIRSVKFCSHLYVQVLT